MRKTSSCALLILPALVASCGGGSSTTIDSAPVTQIDAPVSPAIDATPGTPDAASNACTTYTATTIAAMRQQPATGCYEFDNVVTIGVTPSTHSPSLFVQDAAGGDFSAIKTRCSSTSTAHPCTVAATVAALPNGHSVTVKGTYIKTAATTFEEFFIDSITDNGSATAPAAATATLAQVARSSTSANLRFQRVTVTIGNADTLNMYDWTPSEFASSTATACPFQFGFGMIPKSVSGVTDGAACTNNTTQPTGQAAPNAAEILIGTDFFTGFSLSSDCRCAGHFSDMEPASTSTLSGTLSGLLEFEVPFGTSNGYYYIAPQQAADAAITNTIAGM